MRKILGLLFFGLFLSGCYTSSLTVVGPATGVASGKLTETVTSTTVNHIVKKQTGKTPLEHVLSEKQIKTVDKIYNKNNFIIFENNRKVYYLLKNKIIKIYNFSDFYNYVEF